MFHHSQSQMPQENTTMAFILASSSATFNLTELELTSPLGLYFQIASISLRLCVCPVPNCSQVLFCTLFGQVADYIAQLPIQPPWNMPRANLYLPSHRTPYTPKYTFPLPSPSMLFLLEPLASQWNALPSGSTPPHLTVLTGAQVKVHLQANCFC